MSDIEMIRDKNEKPAALVTGGAGFIGSHLVDELLDRGYNVFVLDNLINGSMRNLEYAGRFPGFRFIKGDVVSIEDCMAAVGSVDIVFHLACLGVRHSLHNPQENHKVNTEGTLNILESCKKNNIKRFFYFSTSEIYGGVQTFPIKEDSLPVPLTIYGASKLCGEYYVNVYNKRFGLNAAVLRIFNNFGPRAHYEGDAGELIPRSIVHALYDKQPVIFGDGTIKRDFIYVKDTVTAVCNLIDGPNLNGMILNIGSSKEREIRDVVEKILVLTGKKEIGINYIESRPADVPRLWVDAGKFYEITGFKLRYSLEEGLVETIDYYKELMKEKNLVSELKLKNWEIDDV